MNRYAILIGNSHYPIESGLQDLRCPENDVDGMAEILGEERYGCFDDPLNLKNRTTADIKKEMGKVFGRAGKEDLVLVYYSGHGKQDMEGQLYLATADTFADSSIALVSSAFPVSDIRNFIKHSKTNKIILILDCCYSGAVSKAGFRGDDTNIFLANMNEGRGTYILTASTALQTAQEKEEDRYGLLTKHIIYGIKTGDAGNNKDDWISMSDLYDYVFEMVRKDGPQTPMKWALNVQGNELAIARRVREKKSIESVKLEPPGGVVRLTSPFYISREIDKHFLAAVKRRDTIVLVKGARQMGKTSLLARALQKAREEGAKVVVTDFQVLGYEDFLTLKGFYLALGNLLADNLNLDLVPEDVWNESRGATINFRRFVRRLLEKINAPLVWGLDEVDKLFMTEYGSEVFGLFRSWYNDCELDPDAPWKNLTMVFSYATEANLFIKDLNQSPFNVGTRLTIGEFSKEEVKELNTKHGEPLEPNELDNFYNLLGGQPYLVRAGLYEMAINKLGFSDFETKIYKGDGLFEDHLHRFLELLNRRSNPVNKAKETNEDIEEAVRKILNGKVCSKENFYRLRSAGLVAGESPYDAKLRCKLYEGYLKLHLPPKKYSLET